MPYYNSEEHIIHLKNKLDVDIGDVKESENIPVYTEDDETWKIFNLLRYRRGTLKHVNVNISCTVLIDMIYRKVPSFLSPNAIVVLDGDIKVEKANKTKLKGAANVVTLPEMSSPERMMAQYLNGLLDNDTLWTDIAADYDRSVCFRDFSFDRIMKDRTEAKNWFRSQEELTNNRWCRIVLKHWKKSHNNELNDFLDRYAKAYNIIAKVKGMQLLKTN